MRSHAALALVIFLGGCSPSYTIRKSVETDNGVFLTFSPGGPLHEGDTFRIVGPVSPGSHGRLRPILGTVKVLQVRGDTLACVKVLDGTAAGGVSAEKVE